MNCTQDSCNGIAIARGLCRKHYTRWQRYGDPTVVNEPQRRPETDRYWEKVDRCGPDDCWPWTGGTQKGYGALRRYVAGKWTYVLAHRFGWELTHGEPPPPHLFVCHTCDNRPCQNPAHWFLGTNADNLADMRAKGRGSTPPRNDYRGERGPLAKLTRAQVDEIRRLYAAGDITQKELAQRFGVEQTNISAIVRRKSWR